MAIVLPSNRQLKVLRFFGVSIPDDISAVQAGRLIGRIMNEPANQERWGKYVYLTGDVSSESANLKSFDPASLEGVILPLGWNSAKAEREYRESIANKILTNGVPFDRPAVVFKDRIFMFTGRCDFGTRTRCEQAVLSRGGLIPERLTHVVDYLVVGARGSERWKHRGYGWKIEVAVVERLIHGKPAIITEEHWRSSL